MRSRRRNHSQNFDSLLDTMANVVGVLVVVLAITQMQVGEAIRRIQFAEPTEDPVDAPQGLLPAVPSIRVAYGREVRRLERELRQINAPSNATHDRIDAIETQLAQLDALPLPSTQLSHSEPDLLAALQSARATLDEEEAEQARLAKAVLALEVRLGELAGLAQIRAHKVRLPDPRPAPIAATELPFFCRHGRVAEADIHALTETLNQAIHKSKATSLPDDPFSSSRLVSYFQKFDIGDASFRWELSRLSRAGILARLRWRSDRVGEEAVDFSEAGSDFRQSLLRRDPRTRYVLFHVWSDSYPAYLQAREIAEGMGYSVGWRVHDAKEEYEGVLTTRPDNISPIPVD